jgi:hypothetical protein
MVPTFADRGCCVVSVTDLFSRILGFLDRSRYFQVAPQLYLRGWVDPVPDPPLLRESGSAENSTRDLWICSQDRSSIADTTKLRWCAIENIRPDCAWINFWVSSHSDEDQGHQNKLTEMKLFLQTSGSSIHIQWEIQIHAVRTRASHQMAHGMSSWQRKGNLRPRMRAVWGTDTNNRKRYKIVFANALRTQGSGDWRVSIFRENSGPITKSFFSDDISNNKLPKRMVSV